MKSKDAAKNSAFSIQRGIAWGEWEYADTYKKKLWTENNKCDILSIGLIITI